MVSTNKKKNIPNARKRILKAAAAVFAVKNFDAARVDQIAAKAGVPKSLIYYHFKSKDEILEALLNGFFQDMESIVKSACKESIEPYNAAGFFRHYYYPFLSENADLVRVAMAETLKKDHPNPPMLRLLDGFNKTKKADSNPEKMPANVLTAQLFFSLIPSAMIICLGNEFSDRYGFDNDAISRVFSEQLGAALSALLKRS